MFSALTLKRRMALIGAAAFLGMLAIGVWSAIEQRNLAYEQRFQMLRSVVETARSQIAYYEGLAQAGKLSNDEARQQAREALRHAQYQQKEYFFIYDYAGKTVLLPPKPEREGTSQIDAKDSDGVFFIRNIIEAGKSGGGFTSYQYPRPGETTPVPKRAYAIGIDAWQWVVGSGLYLDDLDAAFRKDLIVNSLIVLVFAAAVIGLVFAIGRSVLAQIGGEPAEAVAAMKRVAEGDLTVRVSSSSQGSVLHELDILIAALRRLISEIGQGADRINSTSRHISSTSHSVADSASRQSGSTQAMAAAMEELTVSIAHISDSASETERHATHAAENAAEGEQHVSNAAAEMRELAQSVEDAVTRINGLSTRAQEVGHIAATIKEIADQTNLLALNAAIEAARAGETGRGFAVVADEVRKLAERTAQATVEIERTLTAIQTETGGAVGAMGTASTRAGQSVRIAEDSAGVLRGIADGASRARELVREVANAAREQSSASEALAQQVEQIAHAVDATSAGMSETAQATAQLEQVASSLHQAVTRFRC